jgi:hypothetical protein
VKEVQAHEHQPLTLWEMIVVVYCPLLKDLGKMDENSMAFSKMYGPQNSLGLKQ